MPNTSELRHHISAVEQTKKITGAMEMVSSNRMHRVMAHIEYNHRYFDKVQAMMKALLLSAQDISHPYLNPRQGNHCTYIVISGDKGLCGSHNSDVLEFAGKKISAHPCPTLVTIGNTADEYFSARGHIPDIKLFGIAQDPTLARARQLTREIMQLYDSHLTDEIRIIYTSFYGDTKCRPVMRRLLPIRLSDYRSIEAAEHLPEDMIYVPSSQTVFDLLVPQYIISLVFGMMVQAYASEHFARMNAMHSATTNANDMLVKLRTRYNMARQSAITRELSEITGAAEILREGGTAYGNTDPDQRSGA